MGEIAGHASLKLSAPERLSPAHELDTFACGNPLLDDWLKKRALANNGRTSQTFVIHIDNVVIGYYSLVAGSLSRDEAPKKLGRNSVDPIPVLLLGRLAIDVRHHGEGLGSDLLRDALLRSLRIAEDVGVRAVLAHAIDDDAVSFYKKYGFIESPIRPRTLMLPLEAAAKLLP